MVIERLRQLHITSSKGPCLPFTNFCFRAQARNLLAGDSWLDASASLWWLDLGATRISAPTRATIRSALTLKMYISCMLYVTFPPCIFKPGTPRLSFVVCAAHCASIRPQMQELHSRSHLIPRAPLTASSITHDVAVYPLRGRGTACCRWTRLVRKGL